MKKSERKYLVFLLLLTVLAVAIKMLEPKEIDWRENYTSEAKSPFGSYILYDLLPETFDTGILHRSNQPIFEMTLPSEQQPTNRIYINSNFNPDKYETKILMDHVEKGDYIFISAWNYGSVFSDSMKFSTHNYIYLPGFESTPPDSSARQNINYLNPGLATKEGWLFPKNLTDVYFSKVDTLYTVLLGINNNGQANFVRINHGDGAFFLHTSPFLFTNYFLRDIDRYDYAFKALSYLPDRDTYWDEYYKVGKTVFNSPMRYIVSSPDLRMAWFSGLFGVILYLIFKGKRTQRIIPEIEPIRNTSVDFAQTIGRLYLNSGSHKELFQKKYRFFLDYIRTQLSIDTHTINKETISQIANRSGIDEKMISTLFEDAAALNSQKNISEKDLQNIHQQIDQFYKQSLR